MCSPQFPDENLYFSSQIGHQRLNILIEPAQPIADIASMRPLLEASLRVCRATHSLSGWKWMDIKGWTLEEGFYTSSGPCPNSKPCLCPLPTSWKIGARIHRPLLTPDCHLGSIGATKKSRPPPPAVQNHSFLSPGKSGAWFQRPPECGPAFRGSDLGLNGGSRTGLQNQAWVRRAPRNPRKVVRGQAFCPQFGRSLLPGYETI